MSKLEINDEVLASWLWENANKVGQIEKIIARRGTKDYTIKAIRKVLDAAKEGE
jgi:predicted RNA-binding protein YlqC (UPF0109 family)